MIKNNTKTCTVCLGVRKCNRCGGLPPLCVTLRCLRKQYDSSSLVVSSEGFSPSLMHHATSTADIWYLLSEHFQLQWFHVMLSADWPTMSISARSIQIRLCCLPKPLTNTLVIQHISHSGLDYMHLKLLIIPFDPSLI